MESSDDEFLDIDSACTLPRSALFMDLYVAPNIYIQVLHIHIYVTLNPLKNRRVYLSEPI